MLIGETEVEREPFLCLGIETRDILGIIYINTVEQAILKL
jgi:hypothetical protein